MRLPRYEYDQTGMYEAADGEWLRLSEVVKLLEENQLKDCQAVGCTLDADQQKMGQEDGHDYEC